MLPLSGPKIAEALKNAYHKILFPLEQQFRIACLWHQQQHPAMGSSGSGVPNMTLKTSPQLAQMQQMAQLQQQNAQYQQQHGLTWQTPGPQPQSSPLVPPHHHSAGKDDEWASSAASINTNRYDHITPVPMRTANGASAGAASTSTMPTGTTPAPPAQMPPAQHQWV